MKYLLKSPLVVSMLVFLFVLPENKYLIAQELLDYKEYIKQESRSFSNQLSFTTNAMTNDYDVKFHRLEVNIDPNVNYIGGCVTTYFEVLTTGFDKINFDLADTTLVVDSVYYHNTKLNSFDVIHNNDILTIVLPNIITQNSVDSLKIFYQGAPVKTGYGSYSTGVDVDGNPVMWTLSEPFGARDWWPCKLSQTDKVDSLDIIVTTPSLYKVASNGVLLSTVVDGADITFHWKHRYPIATYLIAIAIADYNEIVSWAVFSNGDSLQILNYVYDSHLVDANATLQYTIDDMLLFNDLFGTYPFANEKYGHASCRFGGGMEHQTMSFMGGYYHLLIAHELAHQWFGDRVTCGNWQHIWLNEGWATYSEGMTVENGVQAGNWNNWLENKITTITNVSDGSVFVPDVDSLNIGRFFNYRLSYAKGAMLLHMLRWKLGDADFFVAVKNYLADPNIGYDFALTDQFKQHLEIVSGLDLTEFFDDWFYGEGWPTYNFTWSQDNLNKVHLIVDQLQSHISVDFFDIPIPIYFSDGVSDTTIVVDPSFSGEIFGIPLNFAATTMEFDPDNWIIAKSSITLPLDYLSFTGQRIDESISLLWEVKNMVDVFEFEIQKSIDAITFETIGRIDIIENTRAYKFNDDHISNDQIDVFYRISSVDLNGINSYSDVIRVSANPIQFFVKLYPNPVVKNITMDIVSETNENVNISIIDLTGRIVKTIPMSMKKGNNKKEVILEDIPQGEYYLNITSTQSIQMYNILIQ